MKKTAGANFGGISDAAVQARTGRSWREWFSLLDKAGAEKKKMNHTEIAAHLHNKLRCPEWWNQMVAVGYEQARGLRKKHQTPTGFSISSSRTIGVPLAKLFAAWQNDKARRRWLKGAALIINKATPKKSLRANWDGGRSRVDILFYGRGAAKSRVAADHSKLASAKEAARMKAYWAQNLDRLKGFLEP